MSRDELNDKSSHATTETSGVELTMGCTHRSLNVQGGSNDPRLGDVLLGHRSCDPKCQCWSCDPRANTSRLISKAVVFLKVSDPVLDGALVAACPLSHLVVAHAHRVTSENGLSLAETMANHYVDS